MNQVHQSNEKQPFFKPLSGSDQQGNCYYQEGMMSKTQPYFAPVNTSVRQQKENETMEQEQGSSERLSNLHTRMHQEAEKIRKWRIQTELEIKQKDKKILEASATVESLRKSILELQLQNEHLSLKLQEEIGNREEIIQKIDATREMCNILKDFAAKVEEKLQTCKTERTELKYLEKDHMQQFEELSEKFEQLQISTQETCNKLRNKLNEEADMKCQVQGEYDRKLEKNEMELKCLMDQCCKKDDIIQAIGIKLKENSDCISNLETELGEFQKKLCMAESVATKNTSQLESTAQELQTAKTLNQKLETSLNETSKSLQEMIASKDKMANNFDETERLYVEKIKTLQNELEDVHEDLAKQKDKIDEFQAQLTKTQNAVEDLKCTKGRGRNRGKGKSSRKRSQNQNRN